MVNSQRQVWFYGTQLKTALRVSENQNQSYNSDQSQSTQTTVRQFTEPMKTRNLVSERVEIGFGLLTSDWMRELQWHEIFKPITKHSIAQLNQIDPSEILKLLQSFLVDVLLNNSWTYSSKIELRSFSFQEPSMASMQVFICGSLLFLDDIHLFTQENQTNLAFSSHQF